jgi:hypothetical protein
MTPQHYVSPQAVSILRDDATGITRLHYSDLTDAQEAADFADFRRRVYQLSYDPAAERKARAAVQELKDFRAGQRYDRSRPAVPVAELEEAA